MTDKPPYRVSVVLDCGFGERLITLAQNGPVWIIDNPDNQAAAETCWNLNPIARYLNGVTVFKGFDTSPEDTLIGNLGTIDLHHGEYSAPTPYSVLEVIGVLRTPRIEVELAEYGLDLLADTPDGFRASRT